MDVPNSESDEQLSERSLKSRKSPFGSRNKRSTEDGHLKKKKKKTKPIRSKLALLKKNKKNKNSNNFEVEILVSKSSRYRDDDATSSNKV